MNAPTKTRNWKDYLFTYRSYTPLPFLALMLLFAVPTLASLVIGFVVAICGELVRFWGVSYAGSETRTTGKVGGTQLVTNGPYAYVRNPLYLGNIFTYLGVGIMSNALMPYLQLIALGYFFFQYAAIISIEEDYLSETFPGWKDYSARVNRFVPKLRRFHGESSLVPELGRAARAERSSLMALGSLTVILFAIYLFRSAT
jgi:protein-S-isoprenylcysteine O-methyltransferase Ste14